jgi:tRNA-Thr(GGU) m(6)t(6)A37 methyltransferase TsaA
MILTKSALRTALFFLLPLLAAAAGEAMPENYTVTPVGTINKTPRGDVIEIFPKYRDALTGLERFSHVIVFYWFDRNDTPEKRAVLRVHPRRDPANPLTGVFATRAPVRPNLIGFCVRKIISIGEGRITVEKTDALDRTPVIDLKPYIPKGDCVPDATLPSWVERHARE